MLQSARRRKLRCVIASIDIAMLPSEAKLFPADCYLVIDALRATTTIAVLFDSGLRELTAVDDLAAARERARTTGALLLGELDGVAPDGFDGGNSPVELVAMAVAGRTAVHFTTNGTRALAGLAELGPVIAGAPVNAAAVCDYVAGWYTRPLIVAAGNREGRAFSLEDFAAAGVIARGLLAIAPGAALGDAAALAASIPPDLMASSKHAALLRTLGLGADIDFAMRTSACKAVPGVVAYGPGWATLRDLSTGS